MNRWNLIVDVDKCNNCNNCVMAVKDEYVGNDFPGYAAGQPAQGHGWFAIDRHIRGDQPMVDVTYVPRTCNHCDDAPCIQAGSGVVAKRPDGIVVIDPVKAKGRKDLVDSCPYGAIFWNEEQQLPQHWIFDAHLLDDGWKQPRPVQACPTGALSSVKIADTAMQAMARDEQLSVLSPELNTKPRVYYRGLEKTQTCFLGGNVSTRTSQGLAENVEGALIELELADRADRIKAETDLYGDFKIDGLAPNAGKFTLHISHPDHGAREISGELSDSQYIGTVEF